MTTAVNLVRGFRHLRALVIGDAMLDTYLEGTATRLCREGPVPVVRKTAELYAPGGAANTAANLRALDADVIFLGFVGHDTTGTLLRSALRKLGVEDASLVEDEFASTLHKLRILADGQYVVRFDDEETHHYSSESHTQLLANLEKAFPSCDLVVVSDYCYGVVSDRIIDRLRALRAAHPKVLLVDSKDLHHFRDVGATVITPNHLEAQLLVGYTRDTSLGVFRPDTLAREADTSLSEIERIGQHLLTMIDTEHAAITMAGDGVLLIDRRGRTLHLPTHPVSQPNDVGAGDSFAAAMALALAAGGNVEEAARIALDAASIAVTKRWTAVVHYQELLQRVSLRDHARYSRPLISLSEAWTPEALSQLMTQLVAQRLRDQRIVFTNGVFDLLSAHGIDQECPLVVVHPGCSMPARTYPWEMYVQVIDLLVERLNATIVITGTEGERALVEQVLERVQEDHRRATLACAGMLSFPEVCALIEAADLTVTNNTGPMHISAAVKTPVVALFALTNPPEQWGPWRVPHRQLYHDVTCRICYSRICPYGHECLRLVTPATVVDTAVELLQETRLGMVDTYTEAAVINGWGGGLMNKWLAARSILAVRLDNIGDVMMLGPALRAVKETLPQARLTLLASPAGATAAPLLPWIDDTIVWRPVWQDVNRRIPFDPAGERALINLLAERAFDAALIFTSFSQTPHVPGYVCYLARIPLRAGDSHEFGGSTLTTEVRDTPDELHQVERNLRLVEHVGFVVRDRDLTITIPKEDQAAVPDLLRQAGLNPDAEITLIGLPWAKSFVRRFHHYVDRFVEFVGYPGITEVEVVPERTICFIEQQQAYSYDLVIQMHGSGRTSNRFVLALGGRMTVGYYDDQRPEGLTLGAPYPLDEPEVLRNLGLAKLLGCPNCDPRLEFPQCNKDRAEAAELLLELPRANRPWIGLHAGARSPARRWPAEYFASVADDFARRFDAQVILTGSLDEETIVRSVAERMTTQPINLAGKTSTHHLVDDPDVLLVHVTHYNRLMWDNGSTPTVVIEHSVAIDPAIGYSGRRACGITVVNGMQKRPRIAGYDIFLQARQMVPLDAVGMATEAFGGLGDVPYRDLHRLIADYRFLFSPIRYTSLPLAVIEAMTIGMPVVALATTELPTVIVNGETGYISCNIDELIEHMHFLLTDREEACRLGRNTQAVARERFGLDRFIRDWNMAFDLVLPIVEMH